MSKKQVLIKIAKRNPNITVVWGESFATKKKKPLHVSVTSGLLNTKLEGIKDKLDGIKFKNMLYDVDTYKGKDVSKAPYSHKLEILRDIVRKNPCFDFPEIAETSKEKTKLIHKIKSGKHPMTSEGVILYNKNESVPKKSKFDQEFKTYIRGILPGKGKFETSAGGYEYSFTPKGKVVGIVGGGFTEDLRKDMLKNPKKYIGQETEVKAHEKLKSGMLRMPIHISFKKELWPEKISK